ncbi:MAG: hypothetical protein FWG63_12660 [Defluviitaleaceae bacterium]|nr:hypothetical protein [Defluviitaleaceae bacterium]
MKDNSVTFKGTKDGLVILLNEETQFEILKDTLNKKATEARKFFGNSKAIIYFKGRKLSLEQEEELLNIISRSTDLNITFSPGGVPQKPGDKQKPGQSPNFINTVLADQQDTAFHRGALRSGQAIINNKGSIVVVGDVNPGAKLAAFNNIIVLGTLKSVAHAGFGGNQDAFVAVLSLSPTQIRIADLITYVPREMIKKKTASMAYIEERQIYIAPLL